ncbi:MAG: hypothetical protein E7396_01190 [Ruminococcaceae bacterium]|nr:hypothetical protein [Oscillospiraceae bacterium]
MKKAKKYIIFVILIILITGYFTIPIFEIITKSEYVRLCMNLNEFSDNITVYKLKYTTSTGASWYVKDCTDKSMIGKYIAVKNIVDPRFLKINKFFELDNEGILFISSNKWKNIVVDNEKIWCVYASNIGIYIPDVYSDKEAYRLSDMSFLGIIKFVLGCFISKAQYSY